MAEGPAADCGISYAKYATAAPSAHVKPLGRACGRSADLRTSARCQFRMAKFQRRHRQGRDPTLIRAGVRRHLAAICDGRLAPGARLNQDDLAARMGKSRGSPSDRRCRSSRAELRAGYRPALADRRRRSRGFLHPVYELREGARSLAASLRRAALHASGWREGRKLVRGRREAEKSEGGSTRLIEADMRYPTYGYCRVAGNPLLAETNCACAGNHLRRGMAAVLRATPRHRNEILGRSDAIPGRAIVGERRRRTSHRFAAGALRGRPARRCPIAPSEHVGPGPRPGAFVALSDEPQPAVAPAQASS